MKPTPSFCISGPAFPDTRILGLQEAGSPPRPSRCRSFISLPALIDVHNLDHR
eukprot:gene16516-11812_t